MSAGGERHSGDCRHVNDPVTCRECVINRLEARVREVEGVVTVLKAFAENDEADELFWNFQKDGSAKIYVNCNDAFYWATADGEEVTAENLHVYRQAVVDLEAAGASRFWASLLFCCRVRGMRPQGAYYKHIDEKAWPLFNAAGPERDVDTTPFGNPTPQKKAEAQRISLRERCEKAESDLAAARVTNGELVGALKPFADLDHPVLKGMRPATTVLVPIVHVQRAAAILARVQVPQ